MRFSVYLAAFAALVVVIAAQETVSCNNRTDIVLVLDGSDSIKANDFATMKNASVDFVEEAFRRINQLRIGAVVFGLNANSFLPLTDQSAAATSALRSVNKPPNPSTYTHEGIKAARSMLNDATSQKIMIVITDGNSNIPDTTESEAVKTKNDGINIFTVGVFQYINTLPAGSIVEAFRRDFQAELQTIASNANQVVEIEDFSTLAVEITKLLDKVCISNVIFELRLFNIFAIKGNTVIMTARTLEDYTGSYLWTKDGSSLTNSERVNFMKVSNMEYRLVITDARDSDAGTYTLNVGGVTTTSVLTVATGWGDWTFLFGQPCSVTCGSGSRVVTLLRRCLTSPGDCEGPAQKNEVQPCNNEPCAGSGPFFTLELNDVRVNEGQRIVITGILSETVNSAYQWRRNGILFTESGRISFNVDGSTYRLVIDNAQLTDAGTYSLTVGNQASTSDVTVNGAFAVDLQDVTVRTGQDITVVGTLSSVVSDSYQWFKDGNQLTEGGRVTFRVVGSTYYLTITDAQQSDVGQYTLQVGSRTSTANVGVVQICVSNMDAFLAIDGSGSIGRGAFSGQVIPALQGFVDGYFESRTDRRLGYVLYGTNVRSIQNLISDKEALKASLSSETYPNSETFTNKALAEIVTKFRATDRPDANKFAIVITDGASDDSPATLEQGRILKDELNVTIIVVAVADAVDKQEIRLLASGSEYVKEAQALEDLADILNELIDCVPTWGAWRQVSVGNCNATCGVGYRMKSFSRDCLNVSPTTTCTGSSTKEEIESCNTQPCPFWSAWISGVAGSCSVTCGAGQRTRRYTRVCQNQTPENDCIGTTTKQEREPCDDGLCPAWAAWIQPGTVGGCSVACGGGTRTRTFSRNCLIGGSITAPSNCGVERTTSVQETCNEQICEPVWSAWTEVRGPCSELCGPSGSLTVTRTRRCLSGDCRDETVTINEACNVRNCLTFRNLVDVTVTEGTLRTTLTAQVVVPGVTGGQWFKNGVLVNNVRFTTTSDGLNRNLIISNVEMGDAGTYTYVRQNEITEVRLVVVPIQIVWSEWNVVRGPCSELCGTSGILTVTRSRQCISGNCQDETLTSTEPCNRFDCLRNRVLVDVIVNEGTSASLVATVISAGVTGGQWRKDGQLVSGSRFTTRSIGINRLLTIRDIQMGDAGVYSFELGNELTEVRLVVIPITPTWSAWVVTFTGACDVTCGTGNRVENRTRTCTQGNCVEPTEDSRIISCTLTPCVVCQNDLEVMLAVDSSQSISRDSFSNRLQPAIKDFAVSFLNGRTDRKLGFVVFSSNVNFEFSLSNNVDDITSAVDNMGTPGGETYTHLALEKIVETFNASPANTNKIAIVVTDGASTNSTATTIEGNILKSRGVTIVTVGVGAISGTSFALELQNLASDPSLAFLTGDFDTLLSVLLQIAPDCALASWSEWVETSDSGCSLNCGGGTRTRSYTRTCNNTATSNTCVGDNTKSTTEACNTTPCEDISYRWLEWVEMRSECSVSCGGGTYKIIRTRSCEDPTNSCQGPSTQTILEACNTQACAASFGQWTEWGLWNPSCPSCGPDTIDQVRTRVCRQIPGDLPCPGDSLQNRSLNCNIDLCEGTWDPWGAWTDPGCPTCGFGVRRTISRSRTCSRLPGQGPCSGSDTDTQIVTCAIDRCIRVWNVWSAWTTPSCPTCGPAGTTARVTRSRTCRPGNVEDLFCVGDSSEAKNEPCSIPVCVGTWDPWGAWTDPGCPTCGFNVRRTISRSRTCSRLSGQGPCSGSDTDTQIVTCAIDRCIRVWNDWSAWTTPSCPSCGPAGTTARVTRSRTCRPGNAEDLFCVGDSSEAKNEPCSIPVCVGTWDPWGAWTDPGCPTCGFNVRRTISRSRTCSRLSGQGPCSGSDTDTQIVTCAIDRCIRVWNDWSAWTTPFCPTCGPAGTTARVTRSRTCRPGNAEDLFCVGDSSEAKNEPCSIPVCVGTWDPWGAWTDPGCPTCGFNVRRTISRSRTCSRLSGQGPCSGSETDIQIVTCAIDRCIRVWNDWSAWTTPSCPTCGPAGTTARVTRSRTCRPGNAEDLFCVGDLSEAKNEPCSIPVCVEATWQAWGDWSSPCPSPCSDFARTVTERRTRGCDRRGAVTDCAGVSEESRSAVCTLCPVWRDWSQWASTCPVGCSNVFIRGVKTRRRTCDLRGSTLTCSGPEFESLPDTCTFCTALWSAWSTWIGRSCPPCGLPQTVRQTRTRTCTPFTGQPTCVGVGEDFRDQPCDIENCRGTFEPWTEWSLPNCPDCGDTGILRGVSRTRACRKVLPTYDDCLGPDVDNKLVTCTIEQCDTGIWSPWNSWSNPCPSPCSNTPVSRLQNRNRNCVKVQTTDKDCPGQSSESQTIDCPVCGVGRWTEWTPWSPAPNCPACGDRVFKDQSRTRRCIRSGFESPCTGDTVQSRRFECNIERCPPPPGFDNYGLCLNVRNISGVGYRYHPEDCDKYIQCYFNPNGEVTAMHRSCPFGHYWSQATLRCDFSWRVHCPLERCNDSCISSHNMEGSCRAYWSCEKGRSEAKCCTPSFRYVPGRGCRYDPLCQDPCPLGCTSRDACDKAPVWGEPQKYKINVGLLGWMESKCLNGSSFDLLDCGCSLTKTTTCQSEFDLNFDDPSAITSAIGNWLTSESVKVEEGVAKFDGVGKLSTDTKLSEAGVGCPFVLQFRYLRTGSGRTRQVMASSKDCTHGNTMVVSQYNDSVVIELMSWFGPLLSLPISTENLSPLDWKDFTMVYNGKLLTAMITDSNYRVIAQVSAPHVLLGACGLQFGSDGSILTAFEGQMDEIRLYKCDPGNLF